VRLALEILDVRDSAAGEAGRRIGIAWALIGTLRALPIAVRGRRRTLPADLTAAADLDERSFFELTPSDALAAVTTRIAEIARVHLAEAQSLRPRVSPAALPALLPAVLARARLRQLKRARHNPFDQSLSSADALASWRLTLAALARRY
jgi:phytoene synthase